ncbi:MAG TPA: hypothetical protein PKA05_15425 [Roseiflexaceae bacterium]|nr:hypothetical protein [Roseiflexaceae bacterium]HMP41769.1 hypothetical protein [Roseiflexaceae bacterium]
MNNAPTVRQTAAFLVFLAGLFIIALLVVAQLPAPQTAGIQPTPLPFEAAPTELPPASAACRDRAQPYLAQIDPLLAEWDGARRSAGRASDADLPGQVTALEGLRSRAEGITPPACVAPAHALLIEAMDLVIQAYRGFVIERPEEPLRALLDAADQRYTVVIEQYTTLR